MFENIFDKENEKDEDPKYHKRKMEVGRYIYMWLYHSNGSKSPFKVQRNPERVEIQEGEGRSIGGALENVANTTP